MSETKSHINVKRGSDKNFGMVFATVFAIVALWPLVSGGSPRWWLLAIAVVFLLVTFIHPALFHRPNILWFKFGILLGAIIAPLVMILVYIIAVAPIGVLMRLTGKDLLSLKIDPDAKSYWVERNDTKGSMKDQF